MLELQEPEGTKYHVRCFVTAEHGSYSCSAMTILNVDRLAHFAILAGKNYIIALSVEKEKNGLARTAETTERQANFIAPRRLIFAIV
jgi:hypothetical protein